MFFYTSFKFSILSIIKSKTFIAINSIFLLLIILLNLSFGLFIRISQSEMAQLFLLEYINIIIIMIQITVLSLLFSNDFFYNQKRNGIKTIEVKNGMKIWQIFFSKLVAIILMIFLVSFCISTIVVIENLIIFSENIYVTKLIFVNLYLIFLVPFFIFSLNLIILCLNMQKLTLIFSSFFLGLLSLFHFFNAAVYDFESYNPEAAGSNNVEISNYDIYFNYYILDYKKNNKSENKLLLDLEEYNSENLNLKELLYYDGEENLECNELEKNELTCDVKKYYRYFLSYNSFYRSGGLFYDIDLFNKFNKEFLVNFANYRELKFNEDLIEKNILFKELYNFDIEKSKYDLFEKNNYLINSSNILIELKFYIKNLEKYFKNNQELNYYYSDLKKINNVILDMYEKGFYFKNELYFLSNSIGQVSKDDYNIFREDFISLSPIEKRQKVFELQDISNGKSVHQSILFYIINNYKGDKLYTNKVQKPNDYIPNFYKMSNYYTSPFLWLEFFAKFGFVEKKFDNISTINSSHFIQTNNFLKLDYDIYQEDESSIERFIIKDYNYRGPNTALLVFLILLYCTLLIVLSYVFYKMNFYK
ncbi:ABC transporter permease [Spiroplasma cantharicola]|uniref:Uncharacterized protein n=1 Tax=Spiroplasma cantharicola TaxID=362837 RepID=A0A0M4JJG2_9MOLU|nr:ABC transporter permease [Spiroplasma cantharicola]ALD66323.1 hypothetical protein SCANT_v1c04150 [Spiroplasma cantharicola]